MMVSINGDLHMDCLFHGKSQSKTDDEQGACT